MHDAVLFDFFLVYPQTVHFESFLTEYLAALAFSAVAVALGGLWGIVPDRAASGAITEQAPDCSLPLSSSPPRSFHLPLGTLCSGAIQILTRPLNRVTCVRI